MTDAEPLTGYWAGFPTTYRAEQVATIMSWLAVGESGLVIGARGSGKSNLIGFLRSRPDVTSRHGPGSANNYFFLHLDLNSLPALTILDFYRGMAHVLQEAATQFDSDTQLAMQTLIQDQANWSDAFAALALLHKAHRLLSQHGLKFVWLLERFDEVCRRLDAQTLNTLRSLRDQLRGQLCYVITTRQPLTHLRNLAEIDQFYDLIAANTCWVGPMVEQDARWMVRQMSTRLQTRFSETETGQLITLSGSWPSFLKAACLALARGELSLARQNCAERLLARPEFQRHCQQLWTELSTLEQATLIGLRTGRARLDTRSVVYLEQLGLLIPSTTKGAPPRIFSPIFEQFIRHQQQVATDAITLHPQTRAVLRGGVSLQVELTLQEDRLLSYFLEHAGEICPKETLIRAVWPRDRLLEGIRDDRLAQLIKRLREKIEPDPANPVYIQTVHRRGYRFVQPKREI